MSPRRAADLTLEHVLLALLDRAPMHGYELYQELCALKGISLVWNIKQALLYALLDKLEARGLLASELVQGDAYPPRNTFHLTAEGRETLRAWYQTPVRRARDFRQEFLAKLIVARRYGKSEALGLIRAQQGACRSWQRDLSATAAAGTADEWLVHSFRLERVNGLLAWLGRVEVETEQDFLEAEGRGSAPGEPQPPTSAR